MKLEYAQKWNGIYLLSAAEIEEIADKVLSAFAPQTLLAPMAVDIENIAQEQLDLTIKNRYFSQNGDVLGMMVFDDFSAALYGEDKQWRKEVFESGTMIVDQRLRDNEQIGRRRFTIGHETSHWLLHRPYHSGLGLSYQLRGKQYQNMVACRVGSSFRSCNAYRTDHEWEEWQADHLSASLLMPRMMFRYAAQEIMRQHGYGTYLVEHTRGGELNTVVSELSELFNVSHTAARVRLRQFGIIKSLDIFMD